IGGRAGGLDDEYVLAAHIFIQFNADFAVAETTNQRVTKGDMQLTHDTSRQIGVRIPGKNHHLGHAAIPFLGSGLCDESVREPGEQKPAWPVKPDSRCHELLLPEKMAGAAGFEPTHGRIKTCCLTAWLRPCNCPDAKVASFLRRFVE